MRIKNSPIKLRNEIEEVNKYFISKNDIVINENIKKTRRCDLCYINVHRASDAKLLKRTNHLKNI